MDKLDKKKEREEYLKLLAEHGMTEEEDEAMAHLMYEYDY